MIKSTYSEIYNKRSKYSHTNNSNSNAENNENLLITASTSSPNSNTSALNEMISPNLNQNSSMSSIDDVNRSITSSPISSPVTSTCQLVNSMPLSSITNKLTNNKPIDLANSNSVASTICSQSNYYSNSLQQNYENYHIPNHWIPFYGAQQQHMPQLQHSHGPQQYQFYSSQIPSSSHQFQTNNLTRLNNNRTSTGSSPDSSSTSLNSPPSIDQNSSITISTLNNTQLVQNSRFNGYNLPNTHTSTFNTTKGNTLLTSSTETISNLHATTPIPCDSTLTSSILQTSSTLSNLLSIANTSQNSNDESLPLKKRRPVPIENKDHQYWEKRRKNNESAKRSRDLRRSKEEHISIRVIYLEQENLKLRTEVALLRSETEKLRSMLYANSNNNNINLNTNSASNR